MEQAGAAGIVLEPSGPEWRDFEKRRPVGAEADGAVLRPERLEPEDGAVIIGDAVDIARLETDRGDMDRPRQREGQIIPGNSGGHRWTSFSIMP